jgi:hypothetical protein
MDGRRGADDGLDRRQVCIRLGAKDRADSAHDRAFHLSWRQIELRRQAVHAAERRRSQGRGDRERRRQRCRRHETARPRRSPPRASAEVAIAAATSIIAEQSPYALRTSFTADRSAGRIRWDRPGGAIEAAAPSLGLEASPVNPRPPTRDQARRSCLRTLCERLTHRDCQRPIGVLSRWLPDTNCQDI